MRPVRRHRGALLSLAWVAFASVAALFVFVSALQRHTRTTANAESSLSMSSGSLVTTACCREPGAQNHGRIHHVAGSFDSAELPRGTGSAVPALGSHRHSDFVPFQTSPPSE